MGSASSIDTLPRKAIHFGAGNIGRGFIGILLVESGYEIVFADVDKDVIQALTEQDPYTVYILDEEEFRYPVYNISGIPSTSDDIIREFAHPAVDLVTTALGPAVLEKVAPTIARGLCARREADAGPMNIITCENFVNQTSLLRDRVFSYLQDEDKAWAEENVGFANCSVDRIVPPYDPKDSNSPLDVSVEGFYQWVADKDSAAPPERTRPDVRLKGIRLSTNLDAYIERKLFTLNCGHAITAYLGFLKGYKTIDEAVRDADIRETVHAALLDEAGAALVRKHQPEFDEEEYGAYVEKIMQRFANPRLKDELVRVGRQPLRKLARGDRLLGPMYLALQYGLPIDNLATGVAAAFLYDNPEDSQSVDLEQQVETRGIEKAVADVTGFEEGSKEHAKILDAYHSLHGQCQQLE